MDSTKAPLVWRKQGDETMPAELWRAEAPASHRAGPQAPPHFPGSQEAEGGSFLLWCPRPTEGCCAMSWPLEGAAQPADP